MLGENTMAQLVGPVKTFIATKPTLKTHFFQLANIENGVRKVLVVLKVTKEHVKVSHGYSEVKFGNPGSLGNMTLPPRGESCNRTMQRRAR